MRCHVVQTKSSGEAHASLKSVPSIETLVTNECSNSILNLLSKLCHRYTRLRNRLHVLPDLTMDFGGFAIVGQEAVIHVIYGSQMAQLLVCCTFQVLIAAGVLDDFTLRILLSVEDGSEGNTRRDRLTVTASLLLLTSLVPFLLFLVFRLVNLILGCIYDQLTARIAFRLHTGSGLVVVVGFIIILPFECTRNKSSR
jgi:hypothetical protein